VALLTAPDTRTALARIAARFHGHPADDLLLIGITGTNGKTTVTYLVDRILSAAGFRVGVIGTIHYRYGDTVTDAPMTTPEAPDLQRILAEMREAGITHVVMEASSHALDPATARLHGCRFDVGVFTNLSQDHLDFHHDMETYWGCKKRLFTHHLTDGDRPGFAVINLDDPRGRSLAAELDGPVVTTGNGPDCAVTARVRRTDVTGITARFQTPAGAFDCRSPLSGDHNLENLLSAVGAGTALSLPPAAMAAGIESVAAVPGRLERVISDPHDPRTVFVDYAHTPDALKNVLTALRPLTRGRLICVFGCGGDRDRDKRPKMGRIAATLSDLAVVTSDNPRSEPPLSIIEEILPGVGMGGERRAEDRGQRTENGKRKTEARGEETVEGGRRGFLVESDRRKAIHLAVTEARDGDVVLIAGKGHETYQILGDRTIDFDDRQVALEALSAPERKAG
jgi:UDP-N-acetylmuramyl-tripeptide synthetase